MSNANTASSETQNGEESKEKAPSPADFAAYLPYACSEMDITIPIEVTKASCPIDTPTDKRARSSRPSVSRTIRSDSNISLNEDILNTMPHEEEEKPNPVNVTCHYDKANKLIGIEITQCTLPRAVLQTINLILIHQPQLQFITIRARINKYTIPEVLKIQQKTRLTDVCFDDTFVQEANYYILLNEDSMIRSMSLSRCNLNDEAIKLIFERIQFPTQGSKNLQSLILSSNHITDKGCIHIAEALRTNRCLRHLNLADNSITDTGAEAIFNKLLVFPLTYDEVIEKKKLRFQYLKDRPAEARTPRSSLSSDGKGKKVKSPTADRKQKQSIKIDIEGGERDKNFHDPNDIENVTVIDGVHYSKGNNILTYLNLAYNRLGYYSVVKLLKVLEYQKTRLMKERGLMRVVLNGNPIPRECTELVEVENILNSYLLPTKRGPSIKSSRNTMGSFRKTAT